MANWEFGTYEFPPTVNSFSDNFGDTVPRTARLPGVSGGFDEFGLAAAPSEIGKVQINFIITADWAMKTYADAVPESAMHKARNAVRALVALGKLKLYRPIYGGTWWTWARINNLNMSQNDERHSQIWQPVQIIFQVPLPFWFADGTEAANWGEFTWSDGTLWGGAITGQACSGLTTSWNVTYNGTEPTLCRVSIGAGAGGANSPTLQRLVNSVVVDEVSYAANMTNLQELQIHSRAKKVRLDNADAYNASFGYESPDWFKLLPGVNNLKLTMGNVGNQATVYLRYYEVFR